MKRLTGLLAIGATSLLLSSSNVLAAATMMGEEYGNDAQRNECLLVAINCADNVDSIQQRIERLNREIAKGADVYSKDELRILQDKLDETIRIFNNIGGNS